MGKKTGRRATYITFGGAEVKDVINGKEIGVSVAEYNKTHYVMLPQQASRTKRQWLGRDAAKAVAKFRALAAKLKGEQEKEVATLATVMVSRTGWKRNGRLVTGLLPVPVEQKVSAGEAQYIDWLKKELLNPSELARKTGIDAFNHFYDWMLEVPITLPQLIDNFFTMRKQPISAKEQQKTRKAWKVFCDLIRKKTVQEVCLADIQNYENHIHSKGFAPKTVQHYLNRVGKIFSYNVGKFEDNGRIIKIAKWCEEMERLEDTSSEEPVSISYNDFSVMCEHADIEMKAMLIYGLNTASTLIDISRITKQEIDLELQTLSTRREKTGKVKKVAYLWDRTIQTLREYVSTRTDSSQYLFKSRTGTAYTDSGLRKKFKRFRRRLEQDGKLSEGVEFKHLRDTFSTIAKDVDIDPFKINCVMGHSNKGMVDKYSKRQITNNLKEACLMVEREFFGTA
ncbi:MAG: tyrosine-type recombinase/integrase [Phycisphaerae bacterium]|nr:tyrosine-type recombinase/integrase [Phycisphaerae bacterium]